MEDAELETTKSAGDASLASSVTKFEPGTNELLGIFRKEAPKLANMLEGAWAVLNSSDNPDMLPQAAHSIRELIEKAPYEIPAVPIQSTEPNTTVDGENRTDQAELMIRTLAGKNGQISEQLLKAKLTTYKDIKDYSVGVSHHGKETTIEELQQKLTDLEDVFLNLIGSRTLEDFDELDTYIAEGEAA